MEETVEDNEVKDLKELITNLEFFSNQVRFNQVMYQGYVLIIEKLTKIEEILAKK